VRNRAFCTAKKTIGRIRRIRLIDYLIRLIRLIRQKEALHFAA